MPGSYSPILGARWGNTADCQGFASNRFVPQDCGSGSLATAWNDTPIDGALGYRSTVGDKHLKFYDSALAADVLVPRLNYNETVTGQWAFAYNPGGASSFTVASTTVVTNLNADLLDGFNTAQDDTASTVAVRDAQGRLLAKAPSGTSSASGNLEVVNYGFLYSFVAGVRDPKQAALVIYEGATTDLFADHPYTWDGGAQTITINAFGAFAFDGVTVAVNDRVALIGETGLQKPFNGLYLVTQIGTAGQSLVIQRTADADTDAEVTNGMQFWVTTGTNHGDSGWLLTTADPISINVSDLTFVQNNGTAGITAGNGIVKVGNTIHAVQSAAYTTGGIVYANATTTLTLFTTAGVVQATSGAPPTAATGTQYGVPYWATTTTLGTSAAPGSATVVLHGAVAGAPTWSAVHLVNDVTNTLGVGNGGTGVATFIAGVLHSPGTTTPFSTVTGTQYGVTYWTTTALLASTAAGTSTTILHGNAAGAPTWSAVSLTADVSGTLPVANGGTGAATLTGILKGNGTSAITALTGATNRVTFWSDANTLSSNAGFTYDGTTLTLDADLTFTGAQTIQTSTGILTVTGTSGLTLTSGTSNTLLTQNSVNVFTSEGSGAVVNTLYLKTGLTGLGTSTPTAKLSVASANLAASGVDERFCQAFFYSTDALAINKGGMIGLGGENGAATTPYLFASISGRKENATSGDYAGYLQFVTIASDSTANEWVRITSTGNVGIGTTGPGANLHVNAASATSEIRVTTQTDSTKDPSLFLTFIGSETNQGLKLWHDVSVGSSYIDSLYNDAAGSIFIRTKTLGTPVDAVTILGGGNVGIGTTIPGGKLHVLGEDVAYATTAVNMVGQFMVGKSADTTLAFGTHSTAPVYFWMQAGAGDSANITYPLALQPVGGKVGIGTTSPSTLLQLGLPGPVNGLLGTLGFAGNTSGLITMNSAAVAGTWTFTLPTSGGTANYALITDGSGVSSWSILPEAGGGTGRADFYYAETIGGASTFTITHGLGTRDVHVTIYDITTAAPDDYEEIHMVRIQHLTTNTIYLTFGFTLGAGQCRVVVT